MDASQPLRQHKHPLLSSMPFSLLLQSHIHIDQAYIRLRAKITWERKKQMSADAYPNPYLPVLYRFYLVFQVPYSFSPFCTYFTLLMLLSHLRGSSRNSLQFCKYFCRRKAAVLSKRFTFWLPSIRFLRGFRDTFAVSSGCRTAGNRIFERISGKRVLAYLSRPCNKRSTSFWDWLIGWCLYIWNVLCGVQHWRVS